MPPPLPVTVIGKLPTGVEPVVLIVNTAKQFGLQLVEEKKAVAPEGNPDTEKETVPLLPDSKFALIVLVTDDPASTELLPALESAKSKPPVTVNVKVVLRVTPPSVAVTVTG
jgi:hypothetical protein